MQTEYAFDEDLNCLLFRFIGELEPEPFRKLTQALEKMPNLAPGHMRLTDVRQAQAPQSARSIYMIADIINDLDQKIPPSRTAVVTGSDVMYGMSRVFIVRRDPEGKFIRVCRDENEAMQWLQLPRSIGDPFAPDYWDRQPVRHVD